MRLLRVFFMTVAAALAQQASSSTTGNGSPFLSIPPVSEGLRFEAQLPPFEAKDIAGRTWRLEDLRGKLTLVYIWQTFEARAVDAHDASLREVIPGLSDLPEVQRFYDEAKHTKNIQVLTFCRDYDYTHASEYMKEKKYSFPVIADWVLSKKLFPNGGGNPPYWVIDRDARLSYPVRSWSLGRVLYEIERALPW
jgi:peroxiredoxin